MDFCNCDCNVLEFFGGDSGISSNIGDHAVPMLFRQIRLGGHPEHALEGVGEQNRHETRQYVS